MSSTPTQYVPNWPKTVPLPKEGDLETFSGDNHDLLQYCGQMWVTSCHH